MADAYRFAQFLEQGDPKALAEAVACLMQDLYAKAGFDPASNPSSIEVSCMGGLAGAGLLASAIRLHGILERSPDGRKALRQLGVTKPGADMALAAVHGEVRISLLDGGRLRVTAFCGGRRPDSFFCPDSALARNLGELVSELRSCESAAKPADRG